MPIQQMTHTGGDQIRIQTAHTASFAAFPSFSLWGPENRLSRGTNSGLELTLGRTSAECTFYYCHILNYFVRGTIVQCRKKLIGQTRPGPLTGGYDEELVSVISLSFPPQKTTALPSRLRYYSCNLYPKPLE